MTGGTNYLDFGSTNNCGASLAVGASCTINVTFSPKTTGARVGTLAVVDLPSPGSACRSTSTSAGT